MGSSDKVENVASIFQEISQNSEFFDQLLSASSVKDAYMKVRSQTGFGNFLAYQVVIDLLYPIEYLNGNSVLPFSPNDWSAPGPGAQKGISKLVKEFNGFDQLQVMRWLRQNQHKEFERLGLAFPYLNTADGDRLELSLANIQNCLCEFYKYYKITSSNGRARRRFKRNEARTKDELRNLYKAAPSIKTESTK